MGKGNSVLHFLSLISYEIFPFISGRFQPPFQVDASVELQNTIQIITTLFAVVETSNSAFSLHLQLLSLIILLGCQDVKEHIV